MSPRWKILEPIQLGNMICQNRIMMAAHSYGYTDDDGLPTTYLLDYLVERAKGGAGVVVMGGTSVSPEGDYRERITYNIDQNIVPWYKEIAATVTQYDTLILDQLMHPGGQLESLEGVNIVAPSAIHHEYTRGMPTELTLNGIKHIRTAFVDAAKRAYEGGLNGIELKCDQGFLIHQFLSPYYNRRTDIYGGNYENRFRFLKELIGEIRDIVGKDFIIGVRITGDAMVQGDISLQDALHIARDLDYLQAVNYIHVNGGTNSSFIGYLVNHGDSSIGPINFAPLAKEIKKVVSIPVILASMILRPEEAEYVVNAGIADMIAMTRAHIADPEIVNKVKQGRVDEIRPCVLTNQGCVGNHWKGRDVRCIHNPTTGRERELGIGTITSATTPKTIAVIGGGVAGMEFARVAALRGHTVHIFEKERLLGGQLLLASKLPYRQGMLDVVHYLEKQIKKLNNVEIAVGCCFSKEDLQLASQEFDSVVVATGSTPHIPENYDGIDAARIISLRDMLEEKVNLAECIAVVDIDWRQNPLGVAEWLTQKGRKVTIISSAYFVGQGIDEATLTSYYSRLHKKATFLPLTDIVSLSGTTAVIRNVVTNSLEELNPIEQIVFVAGSKPNNDLMPSDTELLNKVFTIGDCVFPRGIPEAMLSANRLARTF